jgi:hypothetical protein
MHPRETHGKPMAHHLTLAFKILRQNRFFVNNKKCHFCRTQVTFLGHVVSAQGLSVDPEKTAAVQNWPRPANVRELQSFLGLANYFRRFIPHYSSMVAPLTSLTSSTATAFEFSDWPTESAELTAFVAVKAALTNPPVLAFPDPSKQFEVRADASLLGTGAVLLQEGRPIAYMSRKFSHAQTNYTTTDQELLAVYHACKEWRCYLEGAEHPVLLTTDHQPLVNFAKLPQPSHRHMRVIQFLQTFRFIVRYKPGTTNIADPLSRHPLLMPVLRSASKDSVPDQQPIRLLPAPHQ